MRLTQKKIEEIVLPILGEDGLILIKYLYGKENVSEFDLSKRSKKDIKIVRKLLYLLYNHNLVGFNRKKDKEKGWYIYYWTLIPENVKFSHYKRRRELLVTLQYRLEQEHKELFFACPKNCVRLNFDDAMEFEFHCSECGDLLNQDDNSDNISHLKAKISEIEAELEEQRVIKKAERAAYKERIKEVKEKVKVKKIVKKKKKAVTKKKVAKKVVKKKAVAKKKVAKKIVKKKVIKKKK